MIRVDLQVEEKISLLVMGAKREASTIADEVADKLDKVATPVLEAVAPRRVSFRYKYTHKYDLSC